MNWLKSRRQYLPHLSVGLTVILLTLIAAAFLQPPQWTQAAPESLYTVDREDDASGLPCTLGDNNDCTLRSAIQLANGAGVDTILFDSAEGDMLITLSSALPALSDDNTYIGTVDSEQVIEIDANGINGNVFEITGSEITLADMRVYGSGSGWANIYIHGSAQGVVLSNLTVGDDDPIPGGCGQSPDSHSGIYISSTGSTPSGARAWIYGSVIECHEGSPGNGIMISGSDDVIIGENDSEDAGPAQQNNIGWNGGSGVAISDGARDNRLRNSFIHDNDADGVNLQNGDFNEIYGLTVVGNDGDGVRLWSGSESNRLGCPLTGPNNDTYRNVIRANGEVGVHIQGSNTDANFLFCNWIGVSDNGMSAAPNGSYGVLIEEDAQFNNIGSTFQVANVISGNTLDGIRISGSSDTVVLGNYIGTNKDGNAQVGNGANGVALVGGSSDNTIGSASNSNAGNIISGNGGDGIIIANVGSVDNRVDGNTIGLDASGTSPIPNSSHGVQILGAHENAIGPSGSSTEQMIAYNGGDGISILDSHNTLVGLRNHISFNAGSGIDLIGASSGNNFKAQEIHSNGGLPIDLGGDGHTPNDAGDVDSGPNTLLNYPVITGSTDGTISGTACACTVHIYQAVGNPAQPGGGGTYLVSTAADAEGNWSASLPDGLTRYDVTLIAVDVSLNASEMSPSWMVFLPLTWR